MSNKKNFDENDSSEELDKNNFDEYNKNNIDKYKKKFYKSNSLNDNEIDEDEDEDFDQIDNEEEENNNTSDSINDPINMLLGQIIKEAFKNENKYQKNKYQKNTLPLNFDLKIEKFDINGNIESEKIIGSKDGSLWFDEKINSKNEEINKEKELNNEEKELNNEEINSKNEEKNKEKELNNEEKELNNEEINSKNEEKELNNFNKLYFKKNKIDYASAIGDELYLNEWLNSNINSKKKFIGSDSDYSSNAIDNASSNGKINILNWWLKNQKEYGLELKYTEKAINLASKFDTIESLEWWVKSNLELKYDHNAIDYASNGYKIKTLEWWRNSIEKYGLKFKYTSDAIDNAKLEEEKLLNLIKWWNLIIKSNPTIKFKYTKKFIAYLEKSGYYEVYNYLKDNKMITDYDSINISNKPSGVSILDMIGLPFSKINNIKSKESKNKYNNFPEDIQQHIKEKEEELSNNMLINGKAKEYIDNLVKIPFGKYKIEKIFIFIEDLIKKINSINLSSKNDYLNKYKIINESDLIDFLNKIKYNSDDKYIDFFKIYEKFIGIRKKYMEHINNILDKNIYGHDNTKKNIKCIISQWLSGGFKSGVVIGIQGPPGVGKTTLIKGALSKCLIDFIEYNLDIDKPYINIKEDLESNSRPFCFMSLGGTTNGSTLSGHNITYHGATSGDIVKHLKEAKIMNPILYFDELDKISNTEHGHEISSILTHITDPVQNSHFTDRYFTDVKIDLSKCIIVFSYNDSSKIDRILLDRIHEIRLNPIKLKEKIIICKKFIIPEICNQLGYNITDINLSDDKLNLIISEYTHEAGVRKIKEKLFELFRMNHLDIINNQTDINSYNKNKMITSEFINEIFIEHPKISFKKIKKNKIIGYINGMFASSNGIGGITPIQAKQIFSKDNLSINITGSVEKVMEESVKVARTVSWNLLNKNEQDNIITYWDHRGIHIHFPDGSTPKDGPSGGTAITCAIYSLLISKPIKNNIAITGEIDLDGNVTQIGGLDLKLTGAKLAGINIALIPNENSRDFEFVKRNNPELIDKNFKVFKISHISDAIKFIF